MRPSILTIIYLLIGTTMFAQNWELFPPGQRNVYISTEQNSSHYVYAYHADSFKVNGSDTVFFFNQKPFDSSDPYCFTHFESDYDFTLYHDPFLMDSVIKNGDHYEIDISGTVVKFYHLANVNESWKSSSASSLLDSVIIKCTSVGEELIFGMTDSVKFFSLTAYNAGQVIPDFSSYQYKLSKSFGFIEFVPFRNLVFADYVNDDLAILRLKRMEVDGQVYGFSFATFEDYFSHYKSGDVLLWDNITYWFGGVTPTNGTVIKDSLITVVQSDDSVCMCIHRKEKNVTLGMTDTSYSSLDFIQCFFRSEFEPLLNLGTGQLTFAVNYLGTYGPVGAWEVIEMSIDSSGTIPEFTLHARNGEYIDTFTCKVDIAIDGLGDFKINTIEGLYFYGQYGYAYDTTGLSDYIPGSGIAGDCLIDGVNVLSLNKGGDLYIAPTLATDFIKVESSGNERILVELYSLEGSLMLRTEKNSGDRINIGFLPDGYYVIRAGTEGKVVTGKFLKHSVH